MAVDYTPIMGDYKELKPFRYWCQKVLPLVYDDSLSYYELLCKVVDYLNKTMEDVDTLHDDVDALHDAYVQLQTYVNNYFDNLDVQEEINTKLDEMASDGSLTALIDPLIPDAVSDWLAEHITPTTPAIDDTLTVSGAGADAKTVGDKFKEISESTPNIWTLGDQTITNAYQVSVNVNIPAGTYTFSALVDDDSYARNCRFIFYKDSIAVSNELVNDYIPAHVRSAKTFTLSEQADIVVLMFAVASSQTGTTTWKNIQLQPGTVATPYSPPVTATDFIARSENQITQNEVTEIHDIQDDVVGQTQNLWIYGDQAIVNESHVTLYNINLPAGTYTLSALVADASTASRNCRFIFYKNSVTSANVLVNDYIPAHVRASKTFTLEEKADIIELRYAPASSQVGTCTWTDIQIEAGTIATPYVKPISAIDSVARTNTNIYSDISDLIGTYTAGTYRIHNILPKSLCHPMILTIDAMYTRTSGTVYPYLYFDMYTERNYERWSIRYEIGSLDKYDIKSYRSIPYLWDNRPLDIVIVVPANTELTIRNAYCSFERTRNKVTSGVQYHAHDGCCNMVPPQTLCAYKMAYEAGYDSAIVIPKISSDGVWFAYHDDTFDISTTILRNSDGTTIDSSEYNGLHFNEIPWSYLSQFTVGNFGPSFLDVGLMKLEDFFDFCARTGISPMFSMHPIYGIQTTANLTSLKNLVAKYNLLNKLIIKVPIYKEGSTYYLTNFTNIFNVFGNDVGGYTVNVPYGMPDLTDAVNLFDSVSAGCTVYKSIEYWASQIEANNDLVSNALSHGYKVSCATDSNTDVSGATTSTITSKRAKQLISIGVTEFTVDCDTSVGLWW